MAARYGAIRRRLRPDKSRGRELSEKHLTLASFMADQAGDVPWAKRLHASNSQYPDREYVHESNFRRDVLRAKARLLVPAVDADAIARAVWHLEDKGSQGAPKPTKKRKGASR